MPKHSLDSGSTGIPIERRWFLKTAGVAGVGLVGTSSRSAVGKNSQPKAADIIANNTKMLGASRQADAIAIRDGAVLAVGGSDKIIQRYSGSDTTVVDLDGKPIIPQLGSKKGTRGVPSGKTGFPEPRYPDSIFNSPESPDEIMPLAENYIDSTYKFVQVRYQPDFPEDTKVWYRPPECGDKILIVTDESQDSVVQEAITRAIENRGANANFVTRRDLLEEFGYPLPDPEERLEFASEGGRREVETWKRIRFPHKNGGFGGDGGPPGEEELTSDFLQQNPDFDKVYIGNGGPPRNTAETVGEEKFAGYYFARQFPNLLANTPPSALQRVDERLMNLWFNASKVRIRDPQGTSLSWEVSEEDAEYMRNNFYNLSGHVFLYPYQPTRFRGSRVVFPDNANGVIAGTANHAGFHEHINVHVENGVVSKVENGGIYGKLWRKWLEETKDVQYPHHPEPGYFYLFEISMGTMPKQIRYPNIFGGTGDFSDERQRSGVLHLAFGIEIEETHDWFEDVNEFAKENELPQGHWWHIHTYFNTIELKMRDTGEWITFVDKGQMTLYDDSKVRQAIQEEGRDPDEALRYEWRPAIPEINIQGSYSKNYASDPAQWAKAEFRTYELLNKSTDGMTSENK